jgi:glycosyltransferase involved in cell wall biosynthesis
MEDRIMLLGHKADAVRYLPAFDLFVHSSKSEALGLAILEAGLAKLPVVATCVGGIPEIIEDGEQGLLVPALQPELLGKAMEALITDPVRASQLGEKLYERVSREFTKERMLSETFRYYL